MLWPKNKVQALHDIDDESERRKERWAGTSQETEPVLGWKKYSSLKKLRRVTAYVMRFVRNTRVKKKERLIGPLKWTELRAAQNYQAKRAQAESFDEEIHSMSGERS